MTSEFIIAVASIAIALSALAVAIWQGILMRRHNRLSLRPHLTFRQMMSEANPQFSLELLNNGIGPAIIKDFQVLLDGGREDHFDAQGWMALLDLVGLKGRAIGAVCDSEEFLAAGQSLQLIKYESLPAPMGTRELRQALRRMEVHIEYQSVYGDKYRVRFHTPVSIQDCYEVPVSTSAANG